MGIILPLFLAVTHVYFASLVWHTDWTYKLELYWSCFEQSGKSVLLFLSDMYSDLTYKLKSYNHSVEQPSIFHFSSRIYRLTISVFVKSSFVVVLINSNEIIIFSSNKYEHIQHYCDWTVENTWKKDFKSCYHTQWTIMQHLSNSQTIVFSKFRKGLQWSLSGETCLLQSLVVPRRDVVIYQYAIFI